MVVPPAVLFFLDIREERDIISISLHFQFFIKGIRYEKDVDTSDCCELCGSVC